MSNTENRAEFGSTLGFILSAAGSAVGLGNIWKFIDVFSCYLHKMQKNGKICK